jgi:hypothetical protein
MGTKATITFEIDDEKVFILAFQCDGMPEILGVKIMEFLQIKQIVNGFTSTDNKIANGLEDLAAQMVCYFKDSSIIGGVYLLSEKSYGEYNSDYDYFIELGYTKENKLPALISFSVFEKDKRLHNIDNRNCIIPFNENKKQIKNIKEHFANKHKNTLLD